MDDGNPVFIFKVIGGEKMRRLARRTQSNGLHFKNLPFLKLLTSQRAQSTMEYFLIFLIVLAAILSSDFIGKMHDAFKLYFDKAVTEIIK